MPPGHIHPNMKRDLTLFLGLLMISAVNAQISIGANEMPHAGDELLRTQAFTNPFLDYATTGPAYVWDFSNLQADTEDTAAYQTVASTNFVYAIAYADVFFNPNRANHAIDGTDIPFSELLPIANPYTFLYRSSSVYEKVGFGAEVGGIPLPIIFNEHDVIYELPLNYGDLTSSYSSWEISLPTLFHYGYEQDRTNEVDGWGAITTPSGVYDVIRVKTTLQGRDTVNLDSLGVGFTIDRPVVREYKWLAQDLRVPVLQVNTTELFGFELITGIFYYDVPRTLEVVAPLSAVLCPGSVVDVHYEATGVYNPGSFLIPANVFTAQLSDITGDFTNAVDIGSLTSTTSGTINAVIPLGTPLGTGYRIRVISSSPDFIGTDNGFDINIGGAPMASVLPAGDTEFCIGGSVLLNAVPGADLAYQWQLDGVDIPGADGSDLEAASSGDYTVMVSNACGADTSIAITVVVYDLPEHSLDPISAVVPCDGTPVIITSQDLSGQTGLTYQWTLDGTAITGATNMDINAPDAGVYTLEITNPVTGCVFVTMPTTLIADSVPTPEVTASGPLAFCEGGSVTLLADTIVDVSYQWLLDGSDLVGETTQELLAGTTGTYAVVITGSNGCVASASVDVVVNALPPAPVITGSADTLYASGSGSFQWYLDGNAIAGATDSFLVTFFSGDYTVTVTDGNGCSNSSDPYTYISTGMHQPTSLDVDVMPNPSNGSFTIWAPGAVGCTYGITDAMGRQVQGGRLYGARSAMELGFRSTGVYILNIPERGIAMRLVVE